MVLSVPVPQEIIECIIYFLQDDTSTMKQCSTVSHSFLVPIQKQLFSTVWIKTRFLCQQLYGLLASSPHIIPYIRALHFFDCPDHFQSTPWFQDVECFPGILQAVSHYLETFSLIIIGLDCMKWADMSAEWQSTLLDLFASPKLTSIRMTHVCTSNLPPGLFGGMVQLKKLGFLSCKHSSHNRPRPFVPFPEPNTAIRQRKGQLDVLEIDGNMTMEVIESLKQPNSFIDISQLREIHIHDLEPELLKQIWAIMQAAAETIESFMWWDRYIDQDMMNENLFGPLDLTILPKLRSLGFRIYGTADDSDALGWIVQALTQGLIPGTLEDLTIITTDEEDDDFIVYSRGLGQFCWTVGRSEFDEILGSGDHRFPNLRRVNLIIDTHNNMGQEDQKNFALEMAESLPRLAERGILFAQFCNMYEVQVKMSTLLTR